MTWYPWWVKDPVLIEMVDATPACWRVIVIDLDRLRVAGHPHYECLLSNKAIEWSGPWLRCTRRRRKLSGGRPRGAVIEVCRLARGRRRFLVSTVADPSPCPQCGLENGAGRIGRMRSFSNRDQAIACAEDEIKGLAEIADELKAEHERERRAEAWIAEAWTNTGGLP